MAITLKGDIDLKHVPTIKSKALRINLNRNIYGTFAEIGAGQEVVRNFFRAGGASGTRLVKMLSHEIDLIEDRLSREKHPEKIFFAFADTVATINFSKKFKGHGWVGVRFQLDALEDYNEIVLHVRFKETDARLQQETLGKLGVNLLYGAFYMNDNPKDLLESLYDNIDLDQIEVDMINFSGPRFMYVDNRLMSLYLVKNGFTDAVMFGPDGNNLLPAQQLYKKNILTLRGSFRPVTKVNMDMYEKSIQLFCEDKKVDTEKTKIIFEITLSNLRGDKGEINERDFLDRTELLCSLGHNVMITNFQEYFKLVEYLSQFTKKRMGMVMGVYNLVQIFDEKYYRDLSGGILEAFGKLFFKDLKVYLYPLKDKETNEYINSENLKVHPRMKELYKFFKHNGKIVDIKEFNPEILNIYSREVLKMIANGVEGWEDMLPAGIAGQIKAKRLFSYSRRKFNK